MALQDSIPNQSTLLLGALVVFVCYRILLIFYRLSFHPLAKFPGPKIAACTVLYEAYYDVIKEGRYIWKIKEMHEKYGPIVRISPSELHIADPDFYDKIYTMKGKWDKPKFYASGYGITDNEVFTLGHDLHRMRRASINPYFSKQKINQLEPVIRAIVEKLCTRIAEKPKNGLPIRLAYESFGTDVITKYCFDRSYDCLDDPEFNPTYHDTITKAGHVYQIGKYLPWLSKGMNNFPSWLVLKLDEGMGLWVKLREDSMKSINSLEKPKDMEDLPTVFHQIIYSQEIPDSEKNINRMGSEGIQFVSAGTDTVANALHQITWYLANDPKTLQKLRDEVKSVQPDPTKPADLKTLEKLPYLSGVILEGLRLSLGTSTRNARAAPDRIIKYQDWDIPAGTPISIATWFVLYNEKIFPKPLEFQPERWVDPVERQRLDKYMVAFSKGTRMCVGINLAYAELYMAVSSIWTRFDFDIHPSCTFENHVKFDKDMFFPHPKQDAGEFKVLVK